MHKDNKDVNERVNYNGAKQIKNHKKWTNLVDPRFAVEILYWFVVHKKRGKSSLYSLFVGWDQFV